MNDTQDQAAAGEGVAPIGATSEPWRRSSADLLQALAVEADRGLDAEEAQRRLAVHGPNRLAEGKRRSPLRMFVDQFADFMILVLIAAGVVAGLVGDPQDTIAIVVIVVLNAVIGFVQEFRAERAMAALKLLAAPAARVRRDGSQCVLPAEDLVPGDIVVLEAGGVVPADLRLVESMQLKVDEAALTGESVAAEKITAPLDEPDLPIGDRRCMAYKGTVVTYGHGSGIVVASGMATEIGRIAGLLSETEQVRTPLQKRLAEFGQRLALVVIAVCAIIFAVGLLRGEPPVVMFLTAISLAVAAIPEALPAVVTVSLAIGARNMVRKNALIRHLPAVETLGSVTYICSDKTGTLTENRMRVAEFAVDGVTVRERPQSVPPLMLRALALNNDARLAGNGEALGDPTEVALYAAAADAGIDGAAAARESPRLAEIPFDSGRALMTTVHREPGGLIAYTKGAPERLLERCSRHWMSSGPVPIDRKGLAGVADAMAARGLRVLGFAFRDIDEQQASRPDDLESELCFIGFAGLIDPPRPEVEEAVRLCRSAGITPVMITGDHPATARAIALRLGIGENDGDVLTGRDVAATPEAELHKRVAAARVYARVAPEQKNRIVSALQRHGEFVAMTGDGVNDAPALKRADIGIAMGRIGTDVAREASDMVLLDDNFATIVAAVREGRRIFDNIRKFIRYAMTGNSAEVLTLFLAPFLFLPLPLLPIHILWINLVTDGLPGLALAVEPAERNVMMRPPRPPKESIFAGGMWQHMLWVGLLMAGVSLVAQAWAYHNGSAHWQSMVFTVLTLAQMGHVLAIRSERDSLFTLGLFSNTPLLGAVLLTFALQMAILYVPALQVVFKTAPLSVQELLICLALSSVVFASVEVEKWMYRRGWIYRGDNRVGKTA
ncbi:MAG: Calcium-transporting ATPase [Gammaproteobacteria bacterium]|nr:Calcium-transporting ATPase [Gammaproteobacteria bacterium]